MTRTPSLPPHSMRLHVLLPALVLGLGLGSSNASAHEGHDHGEPPPSTALPALAPRAEASGDLFEVLLRLDGPQLTLWVDRFASNEPVTTAQVEVEGQGWKAVAKPAADGSYRLDTPSELRRSGSHPLVLTVQLTGPQGEEADLLETTLQLPADPIANAAEDATGPAALAWLRAPMVWGAAALALALAAVVGLVRLRTRPRTRHHARQPARQPTLRPAPRQDSASSLG